MPPPPRVCADGGRPLKSGRGLAAAAAPASAAQPAQRAASLAAAPARLQGASSAGPLACQAAHNWLPLPAAARNGLAAISNVSGRARIGCLPAAATASCCTPATTTSSSSSSRGSSRLRHSIVAACAAAADAVQQQEQEQEQDQAAAAAADESSSSSLQEDASSSSDESSSSSGDDDSSSPPPLRIKVLSEPSELAAVARLRAEAYYEHDRSRFAASFKKQFAAQEAESLKQRTSRGQRTQLCDCMVAVDPGSGAVLGCIDIRLPECYTGIKTIGVPEGDAAGCYLLNVVVDEAARGRGIGRALMRAAMGRAARHWGAQRLYTHVEADNEVAGQLYRGCGFSEHSSEAKYAHATNLGRLVLLMATAEAVPADADAAQEAQEEGAVDAAAVAAA